MPWHRSLRDVNLCNGNVFKSFTDVQVAAGRGAGLALQRTYNSQEERPGPFGIGWTHCYDLRMEEENPTTNENDDALNVADRTDFFGGKHKYHRDADGLYSPPAYLFDETQSSYNQFLVSGPVVPLEDTETGMDGTVKHFVKIADNWRACDYMQDRYGSRTNLVYGAQVNGAAVPILLSTVTDPVGRQLAFSWVNLGTTAQPIYRISQVDGPQYSVSYSYNLDANLSSVTLDPGVGHLNRTTTFGYTSVSGDAGTDTGLLSSISDPLGHTLSYTYSLTMTEFGQQVPNPIGTAWPSSVMEPAGVDANNNARNLTWNINGQEADNSAGQVISVQTDNYLRKTGLVLSPTPFGVVTVLYNTTYDSANNVLATCDKSPNNSSAGTEGAVRGDHFTYGPHGNQLTHTVDGFTGTETTSYYNGSQFFQKKSVTDMNGRTSMFGVGSKYAGTPGDADTNAGDRGSVLWTKDAKYGDGTLNNTGTRSSYSYNGYGQKTAETNQNGIVTNYSYGDAYGNLTQVVQDPNPSGQTNHLARTTSMTYDAAGHVLTSTDPMGQQSGFAYNVVGQPMSASFPATFNAQNVQQTPAETVSYGYGANGRTESVTDNRGTTALAYESGSERVHSTTDPVTGTISYVYALTGNRLSMSLPGGGSYTYQYPGTWDYNSWLLLKDDPESVTWQINSLTDDQGRRIDINSLATIGLGCDEVGNLKGLRSNQTFTTGNNPQLLAYQQSNYVYDGDQGLAGQFSSHRWLKQVQHTYFAYNSSTNQWQNKLLVGNTYTLDAAGKRLTNTISSLDRTSGNPTSRTEQYGYDELNRLTSVDYGDGQTQGYTFDSMGNRLTKTDSSTGNESYVVNAANMLTSRTVGGTNSSYTNDADGNTLSGGGRTNTWDSQNRMTKCVNGTNTSTFMYGSDGIRHSSVVNGVSTDFVLDNNIFVRELHNGLVKATYFMGQGGPAYRRDDANGGTVRWYLYDGLGSVLGEVDPNGNITARRKYDVYGLTRAGSDAGTSKHKFVGALGHPSEDETGLIYMQARYCDPQTGRFISEDSATSGKNWYIYCKDNPTCSVDPSGKEEIGLWDIVKYLAENPGKWSYPLAAALEVFAQGLLASSRFMMQKANDWFAGACYWESVAFATDFPGAKQLAMANATRLFRNALAAEGIAIGQIAWAHEAQILAEVIRTCADQGWM